MSSTQLLVGFHAVTARLRHGPETIREVYVDATRRDRRMTSLVEQLQAAGRRVHPVAVERLDGMAKGGRHQGVLATAEAVALAHDLDEVLDELDGTPAFLLILDGVTDPHNLGACLRTADGAGAHAVAAPRDRAAGLNATVQRVACGAADTVPYITVTNLARTLRSLKERDVWVVGTDDQAIDTLYDVDATRPIAWVLGAEGEGMRRLTRETCDQLVRIPMQGAVESLNVSVASAVCLYETVRQRTSRR
ncbi:23S rRNA (guanosine(2251)-2'-O)-methyltransferase RlmB [Verticiella sediminum]|uniref:23S rRNA (guanosine-2'-O-)-methyltransferase RlmB n=1 Tax=Verticiella sediminum TaxID=1247510 RepID=A0A556AZK3_9BURK|nr:23S rRNA (guanosine(2251)-2'-O)-methyltransferase RlmB [Verticiella sediminum]TSH98372.1 23S rRNA (guanosine(2251)-2'-O)-methyltransferase RlmB [Verticiella sediminum]